MPYEIRQVADPLSPDPDSPLNVASHDLSKAFSQLYSKIVPHLPNDADPRGVIPFRMPNREQEAAIMELMKPCEKALGLIGCFAHDLRIEIQNLLLSDLYGRKLKRREPIDPAFYAISTESADYEKLEQYFENETDWGRAKQESMQNARNNLSPVAATSNA